MNIYDTPLGWHLTHLILLDPDWQVMLTDNEHVVVATGEDPNRAMVHAWEKIRDDRFAGRLFHLSRLAEPAQAAAKSLLESLGLVGPPVKRRRVG